MTKSKHFINLDEAQEFIESIDDEAIRMILESARYKIYQRLSKMDNPDPAYPDSPFDMLYYLIAVNDLFQNKQFIIDALSGNIDSEVLI